MSYRKYTEKNRQQNTTLKKHRLSNQIQPNTERNSCPFDFCALEEFQFLLDQKLFLLTVANKMQVLISLSLTLYIHVIVDSKLCRCSTATLNNFDHIP